MGVAARPGAVLVYARRRMYRVILPVPVAVDDQESLRQMFAEELTDLVSFVSEGIVGMIVVLALAAVRADDRRRTDQDLEVGVRGEQRFEEPLLLFRAPDGFLRAVFHGVGRAKIADLHEPDLHAAAPAERSIRPR